MNNWLSDLPIPRLMREVEIAVYLVHNSRDPEDYFFLFEFEEFVARSERGMFVRPALRIFAGRDDFSRTQFARQFREVFATGFDRMRREMISGKGKREWLDRNFGGASAVDMIGGLVANLVLALALSVGRRAISGLSPPKVLARKAPEAKLAGEIEGTMTKVEAALARIEVTIHPGL